MDIKKRDFLSLAAGVGAAAVTVTVAAQAQPAAHAGGAPIRVGDRALANQNKQPSTVDWNYKPRRLNKCIELWEDNQPIYYTGPGIATGVDPYEQGKKMSKTSA